MGDSRKVPWHVLVLVALLVARPFVCDRAYVSSGMLIDLALCLSAAAFFARHVRVMPLRLIDGLSWGLALACLWSLLGAGNRYLTLRATLNFCVYASVFMAVRRFSRTQRRWLLNGLIVAGILICLRALYQYVGGYAFMVSDPATAHMGRANSYAWELLRQRRVVSWFGAPNALAGYTIAVLPLIIGKALVLARRRRMRGAGLMAVAAVLMAGVLFLTKTVGAVASLMAATLISAWYAPDRYKNVIFRRMILAAAGVLMVIGIGVVSVRSATMLDLGHPQSSVMQRVYYWQSALRLVQENPWQGTGAGSFAIVYPRVKHSQANETAFAHNSFLQFAAETGMMGAVMLLAVLVSIVGAFRRGTDLISLTLLLGSTAFLLHNTVDYTIYLPQAAIPWVALVACVRIKHAGGSTSAACGGMVARYASMFVLTLTVFHLAMIYVGERSIERGVARFNRGQREAACDDWRRASRFIPWSDTPYYLRAACAAQIAAAHPSAAVIRHYRQAIARNPQYAFYYYYLAEYFFRHQQFAEARHFLEKARAAYPQNGRFEAAWQQLHTRFPSQ